MAYEAGLEVEPTSEPLKKGLAEVKRAMDADDENPLGAGGDMGMGKMFSDPALIGKLQANPKTREYLKDPGFMAKLRQLQSGGGAGDMGAMFQDPRMLNVMGVAMGIDMVGALNDGADRVGSND
jgi:stress-induced-phosphoprotein 1